MQTPPLGTHDSPGPPSGPVRRVLESYDDSMRFTIYNPSTGLSQFPSLTPTLIDAIESSNNSMWIDIVAPPAEELKQVADLFSLHPLTLEDIEAMDEREKCETFDRYLFVVVRTADQKGPRLVDEWGRSCAQPIPVYLVILTDVGNGDSTKEPRKESSRKTFLISIHSHHLPHIPHVLYRLERDRRFSSADWMAYAMIDAIVDEFMPSIKSLELECDSIEDLVLILSHGDRHEMLRRIAAARKRVNHLLRLLKPKADVIRALTKRNADRLQPHTATYLRDVMDHLQAMTDALTHHADALDRAHGSYLGQISLEMADFSNRMTWVINKLSAAAVLAVPLSLITGIWGMNVPVPGQDGTTWRDYGPFFAIIGTMLFLMLCMFMVSRRFGWL